MAKIMNVDYRAIPAQAKQIRTYGQELNSEMTTAYQSIGNMHNSWYGERYNALVKEFNSLIPEINELLELVVGEIPFALETVANNYSQADTGSNTTSAAKTAPTKISTLTISHDIGMRFMTSEVSATQQSVSNNFKKAKDKMNTIESAYGKIQWESEAATAFATKFRKIKNSIITAFESIETSFTKLMNETLANMQTTENKTTVQ